MHNELHHIVHPLPKHKYPLWILIFAFIVTTFVLYSIVFLPKYISAVKILHSAQTAYQNKDYEKAIQLYQQVLVKVPSSEEAKLGAAETIFANGDISDDPEGLSLLEGITLGKTDWDRFTKVMPNEYQQYFQKIKVK